MVIRLCVALAWLVCLVLTSCKQVCAIPAFARREGTMCQTCHFRMPELNKYGDDYARRGLRAEPPEAVGGTEKPGNKEMGGTQQASSNDPVAAASTPLGVPLSLNWADYLTIMGHHMYVAETHERPMFDAGAIDLWAAGPFDSRWTGLVNPSFNIEEGTSDVDEAYGQYTTHWADRFGSSRFGQLQPFAILFNQGGPKMPLSDPLVLSVPGDTGFGWTPESLVRGIEFAAVNLSKANAYFGVGQPKLEDSAVTDEPDFENHMNFYGSGEWIFNKEGDSLTVYGYLGSAWLSPTATGNSFHRVGFFGNVYAARAKVTLGYLAGSDDDATGRPLDNSGYFALFEQLLSDKFAAYVRYDRLRRDLSAGDSQTLSGPAVGVSWWAQSQVRITVEGQFINGTDEENDNRFMTEFLWTF